MKQRMRAVGVSLLVGAAVLTAVPARAAQLEEARIFIEYNSTDNDLGFHVFLDGEDWRTLEITNPEGESIFLVEGRAGYAELGLTELFFEGAEPSLDEVPLAVLLAFFPEGRYRFAGETVDGGRISGAATLSHAIPAGPSVSAEVGDGTVVIRWSPVASPPEGFPDEKVEVVAFQVIVGSFQVTLPASITQVTLPPEFVSSLGSGEHEFEVLAIEASGNQTITSSSFETGG